MAIIKQEEFILKSGDMTTTTAISVLTGQPNQGIWEMQVPLGYSYVFRPVDTFSAYLYTALPTVGALAYAYSMASVVTTAPLALVLGANTVTVTGNASTFGIYLPAGLTGTASGTNLVGTPVTLTVGNNTLTTSSTGPYTITVTLAAAEAAVGSTLDITLLDNSKQSKRTLLNQLRYAQVKEFQDKEKLMHLDVAAGTVVTLAEGEWFRISGNINGTLSTTSSYFQVTCARVRKSLFDN
jgi:hypothetical protein